MNGGVSSLLVNFSQSYPGLFALAWGFAYFMGALLTVSGAWRLKYGAMGMHSRAQQPWGGVGMIGVGALLMWLPSTIDAVSQTIFAATTSPLAYSQPSAAPGFFWAIKGFLMLAGVCFSISAFLMLAAVSKDGANHERSVKIALTRLVAASGMINIEMLLLAVAKTFGLVALTAWLS